MADNKGTRSKSGDPFCDEFHRLLGRLVHALASFDFNIGLQLNWMGPYSGRDVSDLLKPRQARLGDRLDMLEQMVVELYSPAGTSALKDFRDWFASAHKVRAIRNDYAHGRWGVPGKLQESPSGPALPRVPLLAFVPLEFDMTPDQPDKSVYLTIEEFKQQVEQAEALFAKYWDLAERHKASVLPSKGPHA
ncbi:hypothetical protein [Pelomonas sp. SE-A7]|uniref:hypothetical protein n=1 Tax=Pelomonas sp. SE-A7 TaxID=3054953 RepID=UPI00259CCD87|nr:hypothetical protein [Pelomonas sp. SE-A7]MDM4765985.1 hypothetical protein [Pelomonas sp. SE-A7]